jgi:putative salt-induced outer membrane protein YdiY
MKKALAILLALSLAGAGPLLARSDGPQDKPEDQPSDRAAESGAETPGAETPPAAKPVDYNSSTSFSFLLTRGNNENINFGFDTDQNLILGRDSLNLKGSLIYAKANGLDQNEIYYAHLKYNHSVNEGAYVLGLARFERDVLAGYPSRYSFSAGGGLTWLKTESLSFLSDIAVGWSSENAAAKVNLSDGSPAVEKSTNSSFVSTILTNRFAIKITASSRVVQQEVLFVDLHDVSNYRLNSLSSLSASISRSFALKMSFQVNFDKKPVPGFKSTDMFVMSSLVVSL